MDQNIRNYSWQEVEKLIEASQGTAVIPIGAIEQHGLHLPIGTDIFIAEGLARDCCERTNAVLIPSVSFGWSPHHMIKAGTITIRPEVLIELLFDIISSLAKHGFKNIILINGHRIVNNIWIQISCQKIQMEHDINIKLFDPAFMSKDFDFGEDFGPIGHAEEIETSQMMYLHEELVKLDLAVDKPIVDGDFYSVDPSYRHDTLCYIPTSYSKAKKEAEKSFGVTGSPSRSNIDIGKKYHEYLVKHLVEVVDMMRNGG